MLIVFRLEHHILLLVCWPSYTAVSFLCSAASSTPQVSSPKASQAGQGAGSPAGMTHSMHENALLSPVRCCSPDIATHNRPQSSNSRHASTKQAVQLSAGNISPRSGHHPSSPTAHSSSHSPPGSTCRHSGGRPRKPSSRQQLKRPLTPASVTRRCHSADPWAPHVVGFVQTSGDIGPKDLVVNNLMVAAAPQQVVNKLAGERSMIVKRVVQPVAISFTCALTNQPTFLTAICVAVAADTAQNIIDKETGNDYTSSYVRHLASSSGAPQVLMIHTSYSRPATAPSTQQAYSRGMRSSQDMPVRVSHEYSKHTEVLSVNSTDTGVSSADMMDHSSRVSHTDYTTGSYGSHMHASCSQGYRVSATGQVQEGRMADGDVNGLEPNAWQHDETCRDECLSLERPQTGAQCLFADSLVLT